MRRDFHGALERTLFLLARSRLLLLELQDVERQLRRLTAAAPSSPAEPLLEEALETLVEPLATAKGARRRIEALIPVLRAEIDRGGEGR